MNAVAISPGVCRMMKSAIAVGGNVTESMKPDPIHRIASATVVATAPATRAEPRSTAAPVS
jgi:hypothetical protein